jgi:hypothetical protein
MFARLLPRHEVYLFSDEDGDPTRFARQFRAAWRRLPLWVRRDLLRHWRKRRAQLEAALHRNATELLEDVGLAVPQIQLERSWDGWRCGTIGQHAPHMDRMWFHTGAFRLMPHAVAVSVVAHELCHAWLHAVGEQFDFAEDEEAEVSERLPTWGFDPELFEDWCEVNDVALRQAGLDLCGWCRKRDVPDENAPLLRYFSNEPERICPECASRLRAEIAAGTRRGADLAVWEPKAA